MNLAVSENLLLGVQESTNLIIQKPFVFASMDYKEFVYQEITIPNATTDQQFLLGKITTGKILYSETSATLKVKVNSMGATALDVNKFLLLNSDYTALYLTNTSGQALTVKIIAVGV